MQPTLSLPVPQMPLAVGAPALLEQPLDITLAEIKYSDGVLLDRNATAKSGLFVYRTVTAGAGEDVWNDAARAWQAAPADPSGLTPTPFIYRAGDPSPWRAMVIAVGQKDAGGLDRYVKANAAGFPRYRVRAFVAARRDGRDDAALSAPSADWRFASAADDARFGFVLGAGETARNATSARLQIRSAGLAPAAYVEVRTAGGNAVEVATCDSAGTALALIRLRGDGSIELTPAAGRRVVVGGALETGEIFYQPAGGGAKRWLT